MRPTRPCSTILSKLDPKIKLEIANALWIDQKASIKPDFISVNRRDYDAEVANGNFQDPATVRKDQRLGQRAHA
jgi:serine protease inhibitor